MNIKLIFVFSLILLSNTMNAADRYWISSSNSNWNNTTNWSTTSGGSGGASIPGSSDVVYFDINGTGTCTLDINTDIVAMNMSAGTFSTSTFAFTINGTSNSTFSGGIINGNTTFNIYPTGTSLVTFSGTTFNANINVVAPRFLLNGSTFNGTSYFEKTGGTNDRGAGGNIFVGNCTIKNTSTNYIMLGDGGNDSFTANLDLVNSGSSTTYLAYNNSTTSIGGNLTISNSDSAINIGISYNGTSSLSVSGNCTVTANTSVNSNIYLGNNGSFTVGGTLDLTNGGTANSEIIVARNTSSYAIIGGASTITNNGAGTTKRIYLGNNGDITFNGTLKITNNSSASNSQIYCNNAANSSNIYNENIVVETTNANCDGVYFGNGGGYGTLAANKTISIGVSGFSAGQLFFRNLTQTGFTSQTLVTTGTSRIYNYNSNWGGNIDFKAPKLITRGTTYNGTAKLEKTGAGNDNSYGDNIYKGNVELINSGSGYYWHANGGTDDFQAALTVTNTGSNNIYIARHSPGITTIAGNLTINNISTTSSGSIYIANDSITTIVVQGNTTITNSGAGTAKRIYVGNNGDITFNGTLKITNNSSASNSQIYCNNVANSSNIYNENIVVEATNANCDGVYFGNGGGSGTLAANKTISIGISGFSAGQLYFRNLTQTGSTSQTLVTTGTSTIYSYNNNWGGNIDFKAPRQYTRGTTYNGTVKLEKSGNGNNNSVGGNVFKANTILINSGSGQFVLGNNVPDDFQADLTLNNTGSSILTIGNNSAGNQIANDLTINNSGTSGNSYVYLNNNSASTTTIGGNCTINNIGNSTNCNTYFNDDGSLTLSGNLIITNNVTNAGTVYVSNNISSSTIINGATEVTNSGNGTTSRIYLGNNGDVIFNSTLTIHNNSAANNSQTYCNLASNSQNNYNENIIIESTVASSDGVYFGTGGGSGTLAANKTISIGASGFSAGQLYFRNFTQTGSTPQSLIVISTANMYNVDSDWGGNIIFKSPRMNVSGTTFHGTAYIEKTGTNNDNSLGGNTFMGDVEFVNSGSGYLYFGSGSSSDFQADVTLTNSGSNNIGFARQGAGHSITGDLNVNNTGTGQIYIANNSNSSLTIGGTTTVLNNSSGTNGRIYLSNSGDITFNGDIDITNNSTATNSIVYIGSNTTNPDITMNGNLAIENSNTASDGIYLVSKNATLANGKTISIKAGGFISGTLQIINLTQLGTTAQTIDLSSGAYLRMIGNNWGAATTFKSPRIYTESSTYNGLAYLEKTGAIDDNSIGGNTFKENTIIVNSGSGYLMLSGTNADIYEKNLNIINSGSANFYLANNASGVQIGGDLTGQNTNNAQYLYIANGATSSVSIAGNTNISNTSMATNSRVYFGSYGDITTSGNCIFTNNSSGTNAYFYVGYQSASSVNITGDVLVENKGANTYKDFYLGQNGDIMINGNLTLNNTSTASNSHIFCNNLTNSSNTYNGNITLSANGTNIGIYFGYNGGSGTLSSGKALSIGAGGYSKGYLYLRSFTQIGSTAQSLSLTGSAYLYLYTSNWGANVSFTAPTIQLRNSTFDGTASFNKTGSVSVNSYGGNTYNAEVTIENSGSGFIHLANSNGNDYNSNATFVQSGSGLFRFAYRSTSTFGANLNLDYNTVAYLGSNDANSWIEFDGMAAQSINNTGSLQTYFISRINMNNSADNLTLNIPVRLRYNANFSNGNIISTPTNYFRFEDNAVVDAVSDNSYIDGPVIKVGNDAFTFPVGGTDTYGNSHYAGIGISAPSATNHSWTANYHATGHSSANTFSAPLTKVSLVEYWDLDRTVGSGNMDVTLYWGDGTRSGIGSIADLRLAHWDGSTWEDKGNDASTGNASSGSITVHGISSFSPFTFGTVENVINPLPISLISFTAKAENDKVNLNWSTASEENNAYFTIERSSDMIIIDEIQRVDGAGNSNVQLNYQVYDYSPLNGISYYRLVQYDFNGKKEAFDWKSVSFNSTLKTHFIVYPNPSQTSNISILFNNYEGNTIIEILDISGRIIFKEEVNLEKNTIMFPLSLNVESGIYFIRVLNNNNYKTKRLIIK